MSWADALTAAETAAIWWGVPVGLAAVLAWWKLRHFWRRHKPAIKKAVLRKIYPDP